MKPSLISRRQCRRRRHHCFRWMGVVLGHFRRCSATCGNLAASTAFPQHFPTLKPAQVIEAITKTCLDITRANWHPRFGNGAAFGSDPATVAGLVTPRPLFTMP